MFKIDIEQDDELMDLVALMARHLGATFTEKVTIETNNRRLAFGLAGMVGGVVDGLPDSEDIPGIVVTNELATPETIDEIIMSFADVANIMVRDLVTVSAETVAAPRANGKPVDGAVAGRKCEYCDREAMRKGKICDSPECAKKQQNVYNDRYKDKRKARDVAKRAEKEMEAAAKANIPAAEIVPPVVQEAQASENPLAGQPSTAPMYQVPTPGGMLAMTYSELTAAFKAGTLANGTRIRALPSGRYYEVRGGLVQPLIPEGEAAGPGAAETQ